MSDTFPLNPTERVLNTDERSGKIEASILTAYFSKSDLLQLLDISSAIGIRFYPCRHRDFNTDSIVALAVRTVLEDSGNKRGDIDNFYILSGGEDKTAASKRIETLTLKRQIQEDVDSLQFSLTIDANTPDADKRSGFFSVFFSQESIAHLLGIGNCDGLRLFCHDLPGHFNTIFTPRTFTAVPVDADNNMLTTTTTLPQSEGELITIETAAVESLAPCPPDCGDPERYLNPYNVNLNEGVQPIPLT